MASAWRRFGPAGVGAWVAAFRVPRAAQDTRLSPSSVIRSRSGQSLVETALLLPILLMIVFNAVNIGYYFYIAVNLATAPRQGVEYSILGPASQVQSGLPDAASIGTLVASSFTGAIASATSANTSIRVCTAALGLRNLGTSGQLPNCRVTYGSGAFSAMTAADADPEAPFLVLNRVDIQYTVTPLIPGPAFNIVFPASLTFRRSVEMRVME